MGGRPDDLHAAVVGLLVGVGADERRQERVMDVDDPVRESFHEIRAQNPHVFRQHQVIRGVRFQDPHHVRLVFFPRLVLVGQMMERVTETLDQRPEHGVVADDPLHHGVHLVEPTADQQVAQAMRFAGGEDHDPFLAVRRQANG